MAYIVGALGISDVLVCCRFVTDVPHTFRPSARCRLIVLFAHDVVSYTEPTVPATTSYVAPQ